MKKSTFFALAMLAASFQGCSGIDKALPTALNADTVAISKVSREQESLIKAKAAPKAVSGSIAKLTPYLDDLSERCKRLNKDDKHGADSCAFYTGLAQRFKAEMLLSAAKYYLKSGDAASAESALHNVVDNYRGDQYLAETGQALLLLENIRRWGQLQPGMKAYLLGDYAKAFEELKSKDDAESQYYVGRMYYLGAGVSQDVKQALEQYRKAAENGYAPARYDLALLYLYGEGVDQDQGEAKKWLDKAADQDFGPAKKLLKDIKFNQ